MVAPVLLSSLTELDELATSVTCWCALDIWTIMQQEALSADQESLHVDDEEETSEAASLPALTAILIL